MRPPKVLIVDYGVGNILSVVRSLEYLGATVDLSSNPSKILSAPRVLLPGVGAFPKAMRALKNLNLVDAIKELANLETPLLAICLGMQLLLDESDEFGNTTGLGLIQGQVRSIPNKTIHHEDLKIPHIGWNSIYQTNETMPWNLSLLQNNKIGDSLYFTHSFMAKLKNKEHMLAHALYGGHKIPAVIIKNRITGCQFHPEKSGKIGLKILERFIHQ